MFKHRELIGALFGSADFDGNVTWAGGWASTFIEFFNNYSFQFNTAFNPQTTNTRRTRGGPRTKNKPGYEYYTYLDTDGKAKLFYFAETYGYFQPEAGSFNWAVWPGVEWKPISNVILRVGPGFERVVEDAQYVTTDTVGTPRLYGNRYVFATLDQRTISANIRLNWAFTPTMSLLTFIQPLISSGEYTGYKALARANSYDFTAVPYAGSDPSFNFKSLRGNAVFRWEYMPGSAMFLVWTQERTHYVEGPGMGNFSFGPDSRRLMDADADNIFLAKLSYYFTL
jgi:hypothetical protein